MATPRTLILGDFDANRITPLAQLLESRGYRVVVAASGTEVLEAVDVSSPRAIYLHHLLPRPSAIEVLKTLKGEGSTGRIRVVVGVEEEDSTQADRLRLCGADALVGTPLNPADITTALEQRAELPAGADHKIADILDDLEDRARQENPLLAHISDSLTGLYNRAYTDLKIADEFKKARRFNLPLTCVLIGIDGEEAARLDGADERRLLNEVAGLLLCESRDIDHLARYRDREFMLLLPHTDVAGATTMSRRILSSIEGRAFELGEQDLRVTASAGIAAFAGDHFESPEDFEKRARAALQQSRRWGGNRCTIWVPEREKEARPS